LLLEGIRETQPAMVVEVISNELDALDHALEHAMPDEWIFLNPEHVTDTLGYVKEIVSQYTIA
jgi:hypothetical protein